MRSAAQVLQAALADRLQLGSHALCLTPTLGAVLALQLAVKPLPKQLLQPGLASQWRQACRRHRIAPRMLALRLTEPVASHRSCPGRGPGPGRRTRVAVTGPEPNRTGTVLS